MLGNRSRGSQVPPVKRVEAWCRRAGKPGWSQFLGMRRCGFRVWRGTCKPSCCGKKINCYNLRRRNEFVDRQNYSEVAGKKSGHLIYADANGGLFLQIHERTSPDGFGGQLHSYDYFYRDTTNGSIKGKVVVDILWANPKDTTLNYKMDVDVPDAAPSTGSPARTSGCEKARE